MMQTIAASLARLRNEILQTDWMGVVKADWKSLGDLATNAKLVVSSLQDVARKLADFAKFKSKEESSGKHSTCNPVVVAPNYKLDIFLLSDYVF
ncbi:hypothetical protein DITRI_Ditri13aG0101100 [Diplodiscus trichospermus]